jgi:hypothetical protein
MGTTLELAVLLAPKDWTLVPFFTTEKIKKEGFLRPGGDFVAPGKKDNIKFMYSTHVKRDDVVVCRPLLNAQSR